MPTDFKSLMFADQSLEEIVAMSPRTGIGDTSSPWQRLRNALAFRQVGDTATAEKELRSLLALRDAEARMLLWAWSALREMGKPPDVRNAEKVLGAVFEVTSPAGTDLLAVYADRTARYLNRAGRTIIWEQQEPPIAPLCALIVANAQKAVHATIPVREQPQSAPAEVRITLLTPAGNRVVEASFAQLEDPHPLSPTFVAATQLLTALIDAATKKPGG